MVIALAKCYCSWVIDQIAQRNICSRQVIVRLLVAPIIVLATWVIAQEQRKHWVIAQATVELLPKLHPTLFYCSWVIAQAA